jgi:hypothetical protein
MPWFHKIFKKPWGATLQIIFPFPFTSANDKGVLEAYSWHKTIKGDKLLVYECVFVEFRFNTTKMENRSQNLKMGGGFKGSLITKNSWNK